VHLITSTEVGLLSRRRGPQLYEWLNARLLMRVESDFFPDHKIGLRATFVCHFLNFELITVSVFK
jgi:hypothetical protein